MSENIKIITDMSDKTYHSQPGYSSSLVKQMSCPAKAQNYLNSEQPDKPQFSFGRALHTAVLEQDRFKNDYRVAPEFSKRSKAGLIQWAEYYEQNGAVGEEVTALPAAEWFIEFEAQTGITLLSEDDYDKVQAITTAVMNNPHVNKYLKGGQAETSIFWRDTETRLSLRCRPDYLGNDFIIDLKTCADASPDGFSKAAARYQYHVQAAMYQAGVKAAYGDYRPFIFLAVEKTEPYLSAAYQLDSESSDFGYFQYRENLIRLADCIERNEWPGYDNDLNLQLPPWAFGSTLDLDMGGL